MSAVPGDPDPDDPGPGDSHNGDAGPRHQARERALGLLYEAEAKHLDPAALVDDLPVAPDPYAERLVRGVARLGERIDGLLAGSAVGWELARMPAVDRAVLRMAVFELLDELDVPVAVVIDEAVELVKQYSTDDSGRFVNGVLSTIAAEVRA
ncbi:MAG TPA: transcription antitermination factor NusB [Acidimicrobiales bacterium]|nr:transcription antitermination factor NusB [Acidimicrobiales bacterium]